jgi:ATP synthase protein I
MSNNSKKAAAEPIKKSALEKKFTQQVAQKAARKIKIPRNANPGIWFGLGMMGLIGWSVVVPTLLGAALGLWLDSHHIGQHSWTLVFLMAGLSFGCFNAWHWVDKEDRQMHEEVSLNSQLHKKTLNPSPENNDESSH